MNLCEDQKKENLWLANAMAVQEGLKPYMIFLVCFISRVYLKWDMSKTRPKLVGRVKYAMGIFIETSVSKIKKKIRLEIHRKC